MQVTLPSPPLSEQPSPKVTLLPIPDQPTPPLELQMGSSQFVLLLWKPRPFSVTLVQSTELIFKINVDVGLTKSTFPSLMHPLGEVAAGVPGHSEGPLCNELLWRGRWRSAEAAQGEGRPQGFSQVTGTAARCLFIF